MPFDPSAMMEIKYGPKQGFALGHEDPVLKTGRWRMWYPKLAEYDRQVYDPPATDSRATNIDGVDPLRSPNYPFSAKYKGMPFEVWRQDVLYRQNPTIKNIYDKWDISAEHPGMKFKTALNSEFNYAKYHGGLLQSFGYIKNIGGKYFDAPNGQQCMVKTWVPVKYSLIWSAGVWVLDCIQGTQPVGWLNRYKMFVRIAYLPVTAAAAWGATSCIMCDVRKKDDNWNYLTGAFMYGTVFGLRLGAIRGFQAGFFATLFTMGWRMFHDYETGWNHYFTMGGVAGNQLSRERVEWESWVTLRDIPKEKKW